MTESGDRDSGKLSLSRPGKLELKKRVGAGKVRQSFSHGRSKQVTVEVKRKRTIITDKPGKDAQQTAGGLSTEERAARARALQARPKPPPAPDVAAEPALEAPPPSPPLNPEELQAEQRARELDELKAANAEEQRKQEEIDARRQEDEEKIRAAEEARRDAEEGIMSAFIFNDPFRGRQVFTNPDEELDPSVQLDWDFLEPRTLLVGSPDNVIEKVHELQEVCNLDYLLVEFAHMGMPLKKTLKNLEAFATKVMPRFADKD